MNQENSRLVILNEVKNPGYTLLLDFSLLFASLRMTLLISIFIFLSISISPSFSQTKVLFINELMAKNDSFIKDDKGKYSDWIEIYNASSIELDLSGYYLTDDMDTLNMWKVPAGTKITSKGYLIFWADAESGNGARHTNFKLGADGETIGLILPDGITKADTVKFGIQDTDISYGRIKDGDDNWIYFENPTFGESNYKSSSNKLPVVVNELMASNSKTIADETGAFADWIELYNNSDSQIDVGGFYLTDEPKGYPSKWRIPLGTKIKPRDFLLIWADSDPKDGPYHTNFKLSKDGDSVAIFSMDGVTQVDLVAFGSQEQDVSYGRKTDAENRWVFFNIPTPGKTNNPVAVDDGDKLILSMIQNTPNPFIQKTQIHISLNKNSYVSLSVYDNNGKEIEMIFRGALNKGEYYFDFDGQRLSTGLYFCRLQTESDVIIRKMLKE